MAKKRKQASIPREIGRAGALCLAFANTGVPRRDDRRRNSTAPPSMPLASYGELLTWAVRMGALDGDGGERLRVAATERPADAASALARAVRLRDAIGRIFNSPGLKKEVRPQDLATVNSLLQRRQFVPDGDGFRWDFAGDDHAFDPPLWPIAQSAAELLVSGKLPRVRQCNTRGCFQLFIDGKHRRLWCDTNTCGSRAKGKRYHDWKKQLTGSPSDKSRDEQVEEMRRYKKRRLEQDRREQQRQIS